jgi:hypothetical protein
MYTVELLSDAGYQNVIDTAMKRLKSSHHKSSLLLISDQLRKDSPLIEAKEIASISDINIPAEAKLMEGVLPHSRHAQGMSIDSDTYPCVVVGEKITWIIFNTTFVEMVDENLQKQFLAEAIDKEYFFGLLQIDVTSSIQSSTMSDSFSWEKEKQTVVVNGTTVTISRKCWLLG